MSRKVEQGDATRGHLVAVATALFTEHGFAATSTTQIVQRASVTRGALYHHFADKEQLFEAAFVEVEKDVYARCAAAASAEDDLVARLLAGMGAFLDACLEARVQRILLLEGPLVLGWQRSLRFDDPYCARGLLLRALTGLVSAEQAEPLTHLLYGALNQAGIVIAGSDDAAAQRVALGKAIKRLTDSLLTPSKSSKPSNDKAASPA